MAETQKLTSVFLAGIGRMKLKKAYFKDGRVESYPRAKNFNSKTKSYDITDRGMEKRLLDIKKAAAEGQCLLKGELSRDITEEPRAGLALANKRNRTLLLDIDGMEIKPEEVFGLDRAKALDKEELESAGKQGLSFVDSSAGKVGRHELEAYAEHIIGLFPNKELQYASYIVHASSSMGMKGENCVSMHIEFILDKAVSPEVQKIWLQSMNFYIPQFKNGLELSSNGLTLKYPLDISVSSNAKLIFIAHPYFENSNQNPIQDDARIFRVKKKHLMIDSTILDVVQRYEALKELKESHIRLLRKQNGLPNKKAKTTKVKLGMQTEELLKNPDAMTFEIVDDDTDFVHLNVNNGDSNAYWFLKSDPTLVRNFKDEPVFRLEDANPIFYEECLRRYAEYINAKKGSRQLIRRIKEKGGAFLCVEIDEKEKITEIIETKDRSAAIDWGMQYGIVMPDNVNFCSLRYDPHIDAAYIIEMRENLPPSEIVNTYELPELLRKAERRELYEVGEEQIIALMKQECPATLRIISHTLDDKEVDVQHFLNWLFAAAIERKKLGTTWVLQGVQGTGKGIMWEHIIQPLFGNPNTKKITIDELEDKFNSNLRANTMILVDEFRHSDASASKKLENRLKLMATEGEFSMRAMHTEYNQQKNFFNMIFFSNNRDAMRIEASDRRINVGSRQERRLEMTLGGGDFKKGSAAVGRLVELIKEEQTKLANIVRSYNYNLASARMTLDNEAKAAMQEASSTRMEDFARSLTIGSLDLFLYAMQELPDSLISERQNIQAALHFFQVQPWSETNEFMYISNAQLTSVYSMYAEKPSSVASLKKYISRYVGSRIAEPAEITRGTAGFKLRIPYNSANRAAIATIKQLYPVPKDNVKAI